MRAEFRLSPERTISVESEHLAGGHAIVRLVVFDGVCFDHTLHDDSCKERKVEVIALGKVAARAIASAMMGCAAEL